MASTAEFFEYVMAKDGAKLVESPSTSVRVVELQRFQSSTNYPDSTSQFHIHDDGFVEHFFADHQHGQDFVKTPGYHVSNVVIDLENNKHHVTKLFSK